MGNDKNIPEEKSSEKKPSNQKSPEFNPKLRKRKCCFLVLGVFLLIFLILAFIRFYVRSSADTNISKKPIPSPSNTNTKTATPTANFTNKPSETTPEESQPTSQEETPSNTTNEGISKQAQIDYFIKVAIRDEDKGNVESPLRKWGKQNVTIQVTGQSDPTSTQCINDTLSTINSLSDTTKFSLTSGAGDIELKLTDRATLEAQGFSTGGFFVYSPRSGGNYNLTGATAYAATDYWPGEDVTNCQIIRHELTHTIGLPYNASGYDYSIFGVPSTTTNEYQEIDKQMIKIILNSGIRSGLNEAGVRAYLANANW